MFYLGIQKLENGDTKLTVNLSEIEPKVYLYNTNTIFNKIVFTKIIDSFEVLSKLSSYLQLNNT